jgi:hypothetical protein
VWISVGFLLIDEYYDGRDCTSMTSNCEFQICRGGRLVGSLSKGWLRVSISEGFFSADEYDEGRRPTADSAFS